MHEIQSVWRFFQESIIPILRVEGICGERHTEAILIQNALRMIEEAKKYNGALIQREPTAKENKLEEGVMLEFFLIFSSQRGLEGFVDKECE